MFYCGKHIAKATKTKEIADNAIFVELEKFTDKTKIVCEDDECAICASALDDPNTRSFLPCGHAFHVKCVGEWFGMGKTTCPYCRQETILPKTVENIDDKFMVWISIASTGGSALETIIRKWIMERKSDYMNCKTAKEKMEFKINEKEKLDELLAQIIVTSS
jgi:hypothetical protein